MRPFQLAIILSFILVVPLFASIDTLKFERSNQFVCEKNVSFKFANGREFKNARSLKIIKSSGFTFKNVKFNAKKNEIMLTDVTITAYQKWGDFMAEFSSNKKKYTVSGKVVACCNEGLASALIVVDEDITDQTAATTLTGDVVFMGDVTFAANSYLFNATRVFLGPDAQLLPEVNADFVFRNANLQPFCDCRWDRILLADASNTLSMDGTTVRGTIRGIHATTAVSTVLTSSNFLDNYISLYVQNSTGAGPHNNSYFKVDDCTFDNSNIPDQVYCYDINASAVNIDVIVASTCIQSRVTHVLVSDNSDNVHIGHENYGQNEFKNTATLDKQHISLHQSQCFVRNNRFWPAGGNVCALSASRVYVGGTVAQMNIFDGGNMKIVSSSAIVNSNSFTGGSMLVENPDNTAVTSSSPSGSEVAYNDFTGASISVDGNNGSVRFRIFDNFIENTPVILKEMSGSGSNIMIFHSNHLEKNSTGSLVSIFECNEMVFANNFIEHTSYYVPNTGGSNYIGVHWEDTEDGIASNNEFQNCSYGFNIKGGNLGTQFTCNEFLNCYHAFYLDDYPTISTQGSSTTATDNCYNYAYAGLFPYAEQIAGLYNVPADWYIRASISCSLPQPFASCYCTLIETTGVTNLSLQSGTANSCSIPSSSKTTPTDLAVSKHHAFQYYPNPVATEITLIFEVPTSFIIYNLQGQQIYAQQDQENALIDVRQWPDGTYIIRTPTQSGKFVVRK